MRKKNDLQKRIGLLRYNQHLLFKWVRKKQEGISVVSFFQENHLKRIAFYFWNEMSELLFYELEQSSVQIVGVVDKREKLNIPLPVYSDVNRLPNVDGIVICTAKDVVLTEERLRKEKKCLIFTINDIL